MFNPEPEQVIFETSLGFPITADDIASLLAIVGSMPMSDFLNTVEGKFTSFEIQPITAAYDKAKLLYNDAIGDAE